MKTILKIYSFTFLIAMSFAVKAGEYINLGVDYYRNASIGVDNSGGFTGDANSANDSLLQLRAGYQTNKGSIVEGILIGEYGDRLYVDSGFIEAKATFAAYRKWLWSPSELGEFYAGIGLSTAYVDLLTNLDDGDGSGPRIEHIKGLAFSPIIVLGYQRQLTNRIALNVQYTNIPRSKLATSEHDFIRTYTLDFQGVAIGATLSF